MIYIHFLDRFKEENYRVSPAGYYDMKQITTLYHLVVVDQFINSNRFYTRIRKR